jgi:predicted ester cyclase
MSLISEANEVLLARGELGRVEEFFAPKYVAHATARDLSGGPSGVRAYLEMLREAFSALKVEVECLVESGDRVAWQREVSGVQSGPFQGFPATNRRITWRDMVTSRIEGGKIAEEWVVTDLAEQLLRARESRKSRSAPGSS